MREVAIIGVGQTMFGKMPHLTADELGGEAARIALRDAGVDPRMIQVAYGSRTVDDNTNVQACLKRVGITAIEMTNVENGCAGGSTAVHNLWRDIAYGVYDIGIVVGTEAMTTSSLAGKLIAPTTQADLNGLLGVSMPSLFGLVARRLMETRGATMADLAYPSVKNHRHALFNPFAQYKKELTTEEIINSRVISDPITLLMCCPMSDGAAAAVLCSVDMARKFKTRPVMIAASAITSGGYDTAEIDMCTSPALEKLSQTVYERAGIGPEDVDVVELHDAFSPEEIIAYEALGLCAPGEGVAFMRSGAVDLGGKVPVNPSGGLLSLGHPLGASGVRVVCEVVLQLRGDAEQRQVKNAKVGLAEMVGGYVTGINPPVAGGIQILKI